MRFDPRPLLDLGALQLRRQEFAAAETFARVRDALPDQRAGYTSGAEALKGAGRLEEAETVRNLRPTGP